MRNPMDFMASYATLLQTFSHSAEVEFSYSKDYSVWWDYFVHFVTDQFGDWFDILYQQCVVLKKNPIHFTRYEDLASNKGVACAEMMRFILDLDDF